MNRQEAQTTSGELNKLYRPLSIGTMSVLQGLKNKSLAALLGGGSMQVDFEDFIMFLFVHTRDYTLGEIRNIVRDGDILKKAYDWLDSKTPLEIAEGVDYFTNTQTRAQLVAATPLSEKGTPEKKTSQVQTDSSTSKPSSDTILTLPSKK